MRMIDCAHCGAPVAEDAATCPHCGATIPKPGAPIWYQTLIAAISVGVAYWFYHLLRTGQISLLGALAGVALYAGAVWMVTNAVFGRNKR